MNKKMLIWVMGAMLTLTGCASLAASGQTGVSDNDVEIAAVSVAAPDGSNGEQDQQDAPEDSTEPEERIYVEGITLEQSELQVLKGDVFTLQTVIEPEDANMPSRINWSSTDPTVVVAEADGQLRAVGSGTTQIRARVGVLTAVCQVTVEAPLKGVLLQDMELDYDPQTTYALDMTLDPVDTTDDIQPVYESDDPSVAAIDAEGGLHTISTGTAHVTVQVGDFQETCTVEVVSHLKELIFSEDEIEVDLGQSETLTVKPSPANTTDELTFKYESSDSKIVSVDNNGKVTAKASGSAVITVSVGEITAQCTVKVRIPLEGIEVRQSALQLQKGASARLETALLPADTTDTPQITYASSNPAVATVDEAGNITAVGAGSAVIYANADVYSASCTVSVTAPLESIALNQNDITLWTGEAAALSVSYNPGDTTDDRSVTWSSSNPAVASVSGGTVQAVSAGTCTVTATVSGKSASCIVRVNAYTHVTGVTLSEGQVVLSAVGATRQLSASVAPANATNPAVTYTSSNPKVASVSGTGLISAVSGGTAVITATADGVSTSCTVTVNLPQAQKVVVLDPGHGGVDPGAGAYGLQEKTMTLKVATYCKAYLEAHYSGVAVMMTRTTDTQLTRDETGTDLRARCQYAAGVGADVMVSLHFNSTSAHTSRGATVLISKQANVTAASKALANSILAQLQGLGLTNRGALITASTTLFDANGALDYYGINRICASYGIPGIIVEHCFMDNASDVSFCDSDEDLRRLGEADAIGIANYLGLQAK